MKLNYLIGDKVKFKWGYPMTCSERFPSIYCANEGLKTKRESNPVPSVGNGIAELEAFVIGIKVGNIMSDYKYTPSSSSQGYEDLYPDVIPAYATGKRETCLVVTEKIKPFRPFLVRVCDVTSS